MGLKKVYKSFVLSLMIKIIFYVNIMRVLYKNNNMGIGNDVLKFVKGIFG